MPYVITTITAALIAGAARIAFMAVGFGVITYIGLDAALSYALSQIKAQMGLAGTVAAFAGMMGIDQAVSAVLSGLAIRVSLIPLKKLALI